MKSKPTEIRDFEPADAEACFRIRAEAFIKLFYDEIGPDGVVAGINAICQENIFGWLRQRRYLWL